MTTRIPLMPKATAVWMVENTGLSFVQIAGFCGLHELEVKGIADGDVAQGIKGLDPIASGQITRDEIADGEKDHDHILQMAPSKIDMVQSRMKKGPRYTPLMRRHDRPNAILWLVKNHPELKDSQIMRLVGTTKPTIEAIRTRSHWNSASLTAADPVTLGLCSQMELDTEVQKSAKRAEKAAAEQRVREGTLAPIGDTVVTPGGESEQAAIDSEAAAAAAQEEADDLDPAKVLARMIAHEAAAVSDAEAVQEDEKAQPSEAV